MLLPTIIRDTREKEGQGFFWRKSKQVNGTIEKKLDTGDYAIEGFESDFVVERKGSASELINNLFSADKKRFYAELERLKGFKKAWLMCEFSLADVAEEIKNIQYFSKSKYRASAITMDKFLGAIGSIDNQFGVPIVFAGKSYTQYNKSTGGTNKISYARDLSLKLLLKAMKYKV